MTIIALTRESEKRLHVYSDSLVSNTGPMISHVCKLFRIPIRVSGGDGSDPVHHEIGFAFAGSSLLAFSSYGMISAALTNLIDYDFICLKKEEKEKREIRLPGIKDISQFAEQVLKGIASNLGDLKGGTAIPDSTLCFFGYCPSEEQLVVYALEVSYHDAEFKVKKTTHDFPVTGSTVFYGDKVASDRVLKNIADDSQVSLAETMGRVLLDDKVPSVGGDIQFMTVSKGEILFPVVLRRDGEDFGVETLMGFNIGKVRIGGLELGATALGNFTGAKLPKRRPDKPAE